MDKIQGPQWGFANGDLKKIIALILKVEGKVY